VRLPALVVTALAVSSCSPSVPPAAAPLTPLVASSPRGEVAWPIEFTWTGGSPADIVRVRIVDGAEREILTIETRGDHVPAPDGLKASLRPGVRYQWQVARIGADGQDAGASALTTFEVKGPAGAARTSP
jgi:hypothetical protein